MNCSSTAQGAAAQRDYHHVALVTTFKFRPSWALRVAMIAQQQVHKMVRAMQAYNVLVGDTGQPWVQREAKLVALQE